ncbi:MAG TPA: TA system VapC family ribonuclease toxin [Longimicrobiales bacterium]|nr:TA system VapC family ribonuclease toxin [Longimicrobiales bacterium]
MFVVDTNVLIYAANEDAPEHARCRELVEGWRAAGGPWYTTWGILYEFVRVVTHPRVLERPWSGDAAYGFVEALLATPSHRVLVETERHAAVARTVLDEIPAVRGNLVHDFHTAVLMREHGVRTVYTRDADFHRFPSLEVVDPLA